MASLQTWPAAEGPQRHLLLLTSQLMQSSPLRRSARAIAVLLAALPVALAASAGAVVRSPADDVIGGPAMATTGTVTSAGAPALPGGLTAAGFVVADLGTGAVYAARNPHLRVPPASTLKTLTALVLLPKLDPGQVLVANHADASVDGTRVGIVPGGRYTVEQLFQALLMMSGNDAAELLARAGGDRGQTLAAMNAKARELQAFDTHAGTPTGLDAPGQTSSPYDLAVINRATMSLPAFRRYVAMRQSTFGAAGGAHFAIQNSNRLFRHGYRGAIGIKAGFTDMAQHTYVGAATRAGRTYLVSMVLTDRTYWMQARALLDWAFALPADSEPVGRLTATVVPGAPAPGAGAPRAAAGLAGQQPADRSPWREHANGWLALGGIVVLAGGLIVSRRGLTR